MTFTDISDQQKEAFNKTATHPLQSYEWGQFRKKTGIKVIRKGVFENGKIKDTLQLTIHPIPKTPWTIGYAPKGAMPSKEMITELLRIGKQEKCIFIQLEPNVEVENGKLKMEKLIQSSQFSILNSYHPLFTKYTFILDINKSEEDLLKNMSSKTRYNIKVAQKHGIEIVEDNSDEAFAEYLQLTGETIKRQGFYAHTPSYHEMMWETLRQAQGKPSENELSAHLFLAKYKKPETGKNHVLTAWIVFVFKDTLYYPYGASSNLFRNTMASNLMMWEVIRFGKKLNLKTFDMWGALGQEPDPKDRWFGFHRFKQGYGATLTEFVGSYDLVIHPILYQGYKIADKLRWLILRLKNNL